MLIDNIKQYFQLKQELKLLNKELKDKLMEDKNYGDLAEDMRESSEVLRSYKKKLISEMPSIGSISLKADKKRAEIKALKAVISDSVVAVEKSSGAQIQLEFKF